MTLAVVLMVGGVLFFRTEKSCLHSRKTRSFIDLDVGGQPGADSEANVSALTWCQIRHLDSRDQDGLTQD